jgi:two-component system NtrC family sensor kinase
MRGLLKLNTLAGKLILAVSVLLFCGSLIFGYIYFNYQERVMFENIEAHARLAVALTAKGVRHGMLTADGTVIQQAVDTLSSAEDVLLIRIYDTKGKVAYSSMRGEAGRIADKGSSVFDHIEGKEPPPEILTTAKGEKVLEYHTPVMNEQPCFTARCHFHKESERILGVLEGNFSATPVEDARQRMFLGTLVLGGLFVFLISVFLFIIIRKFVTKPVAVLQEGMKRLARGNDLDKLIEIDTSDEMGMLARTFNTMAWDIKLYRARLEGWTEELQKEVEKKTAEIKKAQEQMLEAEKLASLGRLSAGVAHELNSPLTGIMTFAHLVHDRIPQDDKQALDDINIIIAQTDRCSSIIKGLLGFARKGPSESTNVDLNNLVQNTVSMLTRQRDFRDIDVEMDLKDDLPSIFADPNQIQQVILNIFTNSADEMTEGGKVRISTRKTLDGYVEVEFTDNGPGIEPEIIDKIFEPFFTTKPVGQGTGLGLPVSYGIIKRHGGEITVKSEPGKGASFLIRLPIKDEGAETASGA